MVVGYLWGIRTEVVAGQAFSLITGLEPWDCKSIAKASKVRILHLPPRAERAPDLRKRRSGALFMYPVGVSKWRCMSRSSRPWVGSADGLPDASRGHCPAGAGRRLRGDVRPPEAMLPLPDVLRARRHPQQRSGAAAVQDGIPRVGHDPVRRRAARSPRRGARVRSHGRRGRGAGPAAGAPRRSGATAAGLGGRPLALGPRVTGGQRHSAAAGR